MKTQTQRNFTTLIFFIVILSFMNISLSVKILKKTQDDVLSAVPSVDKCRADPYQPNCPGEQAEECNSIWNELKDETTNEEYDVISKKQDECVKNWCANKENKWICQDLKVDPKCYNSDIEVKGCPTEEPDCDNEDDRKGCIKKFCDERINIANDYCRDVYMGLEADVFSDVSHDTDIGEIIDGTKIVFCPPYQEGYPYDAPECSKFFCVKIKNLSLIGDQTNLDWINEQLKECEVNKPNLSAKCTASLPTSTQNESFLKN